MTEPCRTGPGNAPCCVCRVAGQWGLSLPRAQASWLAFGCLTALSCILLHASGPHAQNGVSKAPRRSWRPSAWCLPTPGWEVPPACSAYDGREGITREQHNTLHLNYSSSSSGNVIAEISHRVSLSIPFIPNDSEHVNCI